MIKRLRELLNQTPFSSFVIHTGDGRAISVPTADHIAISGQFYAIVTHDDGKWDLIPALHMTGFTVVQPLPSN
jgi:hypothetical protein